MNRLDRKARAQILQLLCEGMAIRAVARATGASKNTIIKLLVSAGEACLEYQHRTLRDLPCTKLQLDEIWSSIYAKNDNVKEAKNAPPVAGDVWTWTAICADTKLLVSWLLGPRDLESAIAFTSDLKSRLANRVQITSDGHRPYLTAVDIVFGDDVDYAMLVKLYGADPQAETRYSPAKCIGARKEPKIGRPDPKHVSTSYAERSNLTMRMHMRRFTRLTNAFSKKVDNHAAAIALHTTYYNFVRIHQTLRVTPAMAAGVTEKLWEVADIVELVEQAEEANKPQVQFIVREFKIGKGYSVRVILKDGTIHDVSSFAKEADALHWIKFESKKWLASAEKKSIVN